MAAAAKGGQVRLHGCSGPKTVARLRSAAAQELRSRHAPLAGRLQFQDLDARRRPPRRRVASRTDRLGLVPVSPAAGFDASATGLHDDQSQRRLARVMQKRVRRRPRLHRPNLIADLLAPGCVQSIRPVFLLQLRRLRHEAVILLRSLRPVPFCDLLDHVAAPAVPRAVPAAPRLRRPSRRADVDGFLGQHVAGVEADRSCG